MITHERVDVCESFLVQMFTILWRPDVTFGKIHKYLTWLWPPFYDKKNEGQVQLWVKSSAVTLYC